MNIINGEQLVELGQASELTLGPGGPDVEGYNRFFFWDLYIR